MWMIAFVVVDVDNGAGEGVAEATSAMARAITGVCDMPSYARLDHSDRFCGIFFCMPDMQLSVDPFFDIALTSHESQRPAFVVSIIALSVSATTAAHAAEASPSASAQNSACRAVVAISSRERAPAKRALVSLESFGVDYSRALSPQQMEDAYIAAVDDFFHIDHSNETSRTSLRARS